MRRWISGLVVAALVAGLGWWVFDPGGSDGTTLTAYFTRSTGLYPGDDVRILGVKVGEVDSVTPQPAKVKVTFTVDAGVSVPAQAKAAIVAQNLVTSRFVQLVPAYTSGPKLHGGDSIPVQRTAVPIEWDEVKTQLTRLAQTLGPTLRDNRGALGGAITTADANLTGTAAQLHTMLHSMSLATDTLASSSGDLFATVQGLQTFVSTLVASDASVRAFSGQLAAVSGVLNGNRVALATALQQLDAATSQVTGFIAGNRRNLATSVSQLETLAQTITSKQYQLTQLLHIAPTALSNFYNIVDPRYDAATGTLAAANFDNVAQLVCTQVVRTGGTVQSCISILQPLLTQLGLNGIPTSAPTPSTPGATRTGAPRPSLPKLTTPLGKAATGLLPLLLPGGSI